MKKTGYTIAVVGATGVVGREMVEILAERAFPVETLYLYASENSSGTRMDFNGEEVVVEKLDEYAFEGVDIALFSAGSEVSKQYAPVAVASQCVVIDNSSCWRMDARCPLVVPEVNAASLKEHSGIIANPNCSTIQLVVALQPLHRTYGLKRVVVSTNQSVSGTGKDAIDELERQVHTLYAMEEIVPTVYPHQILFNIIPHIDVFEADGYTKEEHKIINETRKILGEPSLRITATATRVPVFFGHSEFVNVELCSPCSASEARAVLSQSSGVEVIDNPRECLYPMPMDVSGEDAVFVGRIREDVSVEYGLNMWICADNLRKGAALNAVQIAEHLVEGNLLKTNEKVFNAMDT